MMVAEDVQPLIDLCAVDRDLARDVARDSREILKLVQALGGSSSGYRRERARGVKAKVSEVYSAPRVTAALKLLPSTWRVRHRPWGDVCRRAMSKLSAEVLTSPSVRSCFVTVFGARGNVLKTYTCTR